MTAVTPGREALLALAKRLRNGDCCNLCLCNEAAEMLARLAAKPADDWASCILLNQIEIMGAVSLLLRYAMPDLIGKAGELDRQRDDLFQRHKATQAALTTTGKPRP